jgi:hypothetical protein
MTESNKFRLMLCELHYTPIHGKTNQSFATIETHYLVIECFDGLTGEAIDSDSDSESIDSLNSLDSLTDLQISLEHTNEFYQTMNPVENRIYVPHSCIRNYFNIISRLDYIKPEIGLQIKLDTGETVAIIKTFWLKLIQRAWKRVYKKRQFVINGRKQIASLHCVRLTGFWPVNYRFVPTLRGLLSTFQSSASFKG